MRRPGRRTAALSGLAALGLTGAVVLGAGLSTDPAPGAGGQAPAELTAAPLPGAPPTSTPSAHTTPSSAVHVRVPAVDLDLPVLPLTTQRGVIDPPLLTAAYWIEPYGEPVGSAGQAENTLYLAAHSAGRGSDGFDPLLGPGEGGSALGAGDQVEVSTPGGTVSYTVERTARYDKDDLAGAAEVWEASPGRLVLITCLQREAGRTSTENLVVFAES
ncbi:sortase domain-containing protein [Modestobacter sp. URMC 112]